MRKGGYNGGGGGGFALGSGKRFCRWGRWRIVMGMKTGGGTLCDFWG